MNTSENKEIMSEFACNTLDDYHDLARKTAIYAGQGELRGLTYCTLGLAGEAGEVAEKIKKVIRDDAGVIDETKRREIAKEASDVLWYVANLADELGFTLQQIAQMNIEKLYSRKARGVLHGSGDNR